MRVRGVENKGDVVVGVPLKELFACNTHSAECFISFVTCSSEYRQPEEFLFSSAFT